MRRNRITLVTAAWLGLLSPLATAAQPAATDPAALVRFYTEARVEVDRDGRVVAVEPESTLPSAVVASIRTSVGQWRFKAPQRDGQPVAGVTFVRLAACAAPSEGQFRLAVAYAGNGPGRLNPEVGPKFPVDAVRRGQSARLKATYRVLPDGSVKVDEVAVLEITDKRSTRQFQKAVADWLQASRFRPEQLGGVAVETRMVMPVNFTSGDPMSFSSAQAARAELVKQAQATAREEPTCQTAMAAAAPADRTVAIDSPFELLPPG